MSINGKDYDICFHIEKVYIMCAIYVHLKKKVNQCEEAE